MRVCKWGYCEPICMHTLMQECVPCPPGSMCPITSSLPSSCEDGHYSLGRSTSCVPCPPGYHCPLTNEAPTVCDTGTYSAGSSSTCLPCFSGFSCPTGSTTPNSTEHACPLGQYCPDGAMVLDCPAGTYGNRTGLVDSAECSTCPAGFYCPAGTAGYPRHGLLCPAGHYCPEGTVTEFENACEGGTYSTHMGLHRGEQCVSCKAGRFCSGGDGTGDEVCPRGHFCPQHSKYPWACPGGTFTEALGSEALTDCKLCPAGYFCPEATHSPVHCPTGTYQPYIGQNSTDDCRPCQAGLACTSIALTQPNVLCAAGHYCPAGSEKPDDPDHMCPAGTFTDYHNLTTPSECSTCHAGQACLAGTGGIQTPRLPCAAGHFCPNGTRYPWQYPCAAGTYSNATNLREQEECSLCPAGYYCLEGESAPSGLCERGHFCPEGIIMCIFYVRIWYLSQKNYT